MPCVILPLGKPSPLRLGVIEGIEVDVIALEGARLERLRFPGTPGGGTPTVLHGEPSAAAEEIATNGLKPVSTSTRPYPQGHNALEPNADIAASQWPVASGKAPKAGVCVVAMQVPNGLLSSLRAGGTWSRRVRCLGWISFHHRRLFARGVSRVERKRERGAIHP